MTDLTPGQIDALPKGKLAGQGLQLYDGRIMPKTFGQVMEFAQMMCKGGAAIPAHLRNEPGVCLSVIQRSMAWEMDPWAVATKTYVVKDGAVLAYEAQLIAAVIKKWAPIRERVIPYKYSGEAGDLQCSITIHHVETGEEIVYVSPKKKDIKIQNSPLWVSDPEQQLAYYSIRAMARRHFPEILLGVYDREEVLAMKDITPPDKVENFLEDDPPSEVQEGEILPPAHKSGLTQVNESVQPADGKTGDVRDATPSHTASPVEPAHDKETGELFAEEEQPPLTPEVLAANMIKSVKGFTDGVHLMEYHQENQVAINALPADLRKQVSKVLSDKHLELEEL